MLLTCITQSALAQSDTTCISYLEAFANYQAHQKHIYEKHRSTIYSAYKRAQAIEAAAYKRMKGLGPVERSKIDIPDPKNNPQYLAEHVNQNVDLEIVKRTYAEALLKAYDGPRSTNNKVMWSLIDGDIQRCRNDGFFVSN